MKKSIARLPFVAVSGSNKNYWATAPESGEWSDDNRLGRSYADALVEACSDGELGMILGFVGEAIVQFGRFGGIEVGFFNRLGEIASCALVASNDQNEMAQAA